MNDYLKVTYGGYDGGGVAYTEIDWNSMKEDFENKISYKRGMAQTGGMTPIDIIKEYSSKRTEIVPSTASYDIGRYASFPVEVTVGGATIFVLDVAQFLKV